MRKTRSTSIITLLAAALAAWGLADSGWAQVVRPLQGHATDASNLVGSGGINTTLSAQPINTGNLFITGNVAGGRRFQGFSPIRDSSSLLISLPSSSQARFRADTISTGDVIAGRTSYQVNPYFDRSQTVLNVSSITRGQTLPGSSMPRSEYVLPSTRWLAPGGAMVYSQSLGPGRTGSTLQPGALPTGWTPLTAMPRGIIQPLDGLGLSTRPLAESPLFGTTLRAQYWLDAGLATPVSEWTDPSVYGALPGAESTAQEPPQSAAARRVLGQLDGSGEWLPSPLDLAPSIFGEAGGEVDPLTGLPVAEDTAAPGPSTVSLAPIPATEEEAPAAAPFVPYELLGESAYQDLMGAVDWLEGMPEVPLEGVESEVLLPDAVASFQESRARARTLLGRAMESFAGEGDSLVNRYLIRAESDVREGLFYRACRSYEAAGMLDRYNPLVSLGHGHALLFAGDYTGAVLHLTRGIDRFPSIAYFRTDLTAFLPDAKLLEVRRADLERRLAVRDDYELRFLLGYAEYYSGLTRFGLANLKQAAEAAPADSVIARFPHMLEADSLLHPPVDEEKEGEKDSPPKAHE